MRIRTSTPGALIAGGYWLLTLAVASPLMRDGYLGHGNGFVFLLATALTAPLSLILLLFHDVLSDVNAFYRTGWPYVITLGELGVGALLNAGVIYMVVVCIQRTWQRAWGRHPAGEADDIPSPHKGLHPTAMKRASQRETWPYRR